LEYDLDQFKQQYVYLLQSCITLPIGERTGGNDVVPLRLFGGDMVSARATFTTPAQHKVRVCALLEEARRVDPTLPTYDRCANTGIGP
jgi:hypothetical protein